MKTWDRLALIALVLGVSVLCDRVTKRMATEALRFAPPRSFLGDLFRLQYAENRGAFLSLGGGLAPGPRFWLLTVGVGALLLAMLVLALVGRRLTPAQVSGLALVVGGGGSNLADRILTGGSVVDFMNVGIGTLRTGIFNVADLAIEVGILLLIIAGWRAPRKPVGPVPRDEPASDPEPGGG